MERGCRGTVLKVWKRGGREGRVGGESSYGEKKCSDGVQSCEGLGFRLQAGQRLCATTVHEEAK